MPIDIERLKAQDRKDQAWQLVYNAVVATSERILRMERKRIPVMIGTGGGSYHRWKKKGDHIREVIRYGKRAIQRYYYKVQTEIFWIHEDEIYQVSACDHRELEGREVMTCVILEECAHALQPTHSQEHGPEFVKKYVYLWNKYFDWVVANLPKEVKG